MLYWIYILITILIAVLLVVELFRQKDWRIQLAYAMVVLPLVLRILGIK